MGVDHLLIHCVLVSQTCLMLCDPRDCSLLGSSVHRILKVGILQWVAIPFSSNLPDPGIQPRSPACSKLFTAEPPLIHLPIPLFAHSFNKHSLRTYCVLDAGERMEGESDKLPLRKLTWGRGADSAMFLHILMKFHCDNTVEKGWARLLQTHVTRHF